MLEAQDRIRRASRLDQRIAEISPELCVVGPELHRLVKNLQRVLAPPLTEQRGAEARQIERLRIAPDRTGQPLDRLIVLLLLKGQQTHQVQRLCVSGIDRKRLSAGKLGLGKSAGSHLREAGFEESLERGAFWPLFSCGR